ncbi:hypothetical protein pb186bvf_010857 [Paramecium bursaria]
MKKQGEFLQSCNGQRKFLIQNYGIIGSDAKIDGYLGLRIMFHYSLTLLDILLINIWPTDNGSLNLFYPESNMTYIKYGTISQANIYELI